MADDRKRTIVIEQVAPVVDGGRHAAKREVGAVVEVTADIFREGHESIVAALRFRGPGDAEWRETPMWFVDNDRWAGRFTLEQVGRHRYTIEAATDPFRTWLIELDKRRDAGEELSSPLAEGAALVRAAGGRATSPDADALRAWAERIAPPAPPDGALQAAHDAGLRELMARHLDRADATWLDRELEVYADRERARFAAWYEFFPRSGRNPHRSATLREAEAQLERAAAMGFDVVYLPPIHPIGHTHRKGRNNALVAAPGDPGSPWAIGSEAGGHTAVHPDLGSLADFDRFVARARELGLEVALDFAIQCSPDHPWVREHPEWFFHRPDGSIKYAENPPKKYQDVYPLNFYGDDPGPLWAEMRRVLEFWIARGVRTFRVDNPHTKPVRFWEWVIRALQDEHPDVVLLAEAFTRPKMMKVLAKAGFTQSYTYFTWRNEKAELIDYLTEITTRPVADYFRGNLWPNTPDILHETLQHGGSPAFRLRLVMAATLSSLYGIYSGYELCENIPFAPHSEEYRDSEKYQVVVRDWDEPGNLVSLITRINQVRRAHPALQLYDNLRFYRCDDPQVLFYGKMTPARDDAVFVAASLDTSAAHEVRVELPLPDLGIRDDQPYRVEDLLTGAVHEWRGREGRIVLDPQVEPTAVLVVHR
jgi:starch synthase (maltosyl-transferring)